MRYSMQKCIYFPSPNYSHLVCIEYIIMVNLSLILYIVVLMFYLLTLNKYLTTVFIKLF